MLHGLLSLIFLVQAWTQVASTSRPGQHYWLHAPTQKTTCNHPSETEEEWARQRYATQDYEAALFGFQCAMALVEPSDAEDSTFCRLHNFMAACYTKMQNVAAAIQVRSK